MENNALRLWFNGGSSIIPLLPTNNHKTRTPITDIIILRRTPITEASVKPQYRPRHGSGRIPQYPREASPTSSPNPASLIAAKAFDEQSTYTSLVERLQVQGSCPLRLLRDDGYWNRDQFWAVVDFLKHASRSHQILRVLFWLLPLLSLCLLQDLFVLFLLASSSVTMSVAGLFVLEISIF